MCSLKQANFQKLVIISYRPIKKCVIWTLFVLWSLIASTIYWTLYLDYECIEKKLYRSELNAAIDTKSDLWWICVDSVNQLIGLLNAQTTATVIIERNTNHRVKVDRFDALFTIYIAFFEEDLNIWRWMNRKGRNEKDLLAVGET